MKDMFKAAMAMIGIIDVQMILSHVFSWQAAELFSKVSITGLFYYYLCKTIMAIRKRKSAQDLSLS